MASFSIMFEDDLIKYRDMFKKFCSAGKSTKR